MEAISVFHIFKTGVGPSSSHTMGPWRAAQAFLTRCREQGLLDRIDRVRVDLYGSLAKTGRGHGTDRAVVWGLAGLDPETCDPAALEPMLEALQRAGTLRLEGTHAVGFDLGRDVVFNMQRSLPFHPNGLTFTAFENNTLVGQETYYSVGGGFIVQEADAFLPEAVRLPFPIETAQDLEAHCERAGIDIPAVVWRNEQTWRTVADIHAGLHRLWQTMRACVYVGCHTEGVLPGGLHVVRRAARLNGQLLGDVEGYDDAEAWMRLIRRRRWTFQETLKWVSCFALAVNEENASFGRVVTAPTNGAAGVIPAVLMYYACFCPEATDAGIETFLLTAGEMGSVFKKGATISAALGGCQAEIGVSSAMAAAGLAQCLGASVGQVLMAAEIAMEHHLGMTCDPIGGLVQVPCIERNTMGAVKAITAAQIALSSNPDEARVPLDAVIKSMWETALDMNAKYKETSEGGLAVQIPVNVSEC
jgi:L-serine dehydratase